MGLVIIFCWLFLCEDVSCEIIVKQIVLVLCDEVVDLEVVGIGIIQIDELVLCEGLLLCCSDWDVYFQWGVEVFCINVVVVKDDI